MTMDKRMVWPDIAKAIGIFLVVVGHSMPFENIKMWIYTFHMPLFFFLSGMFITRESFEKISFDNFLTKKFKTIFIPYLIFGSLNTLFLIPVWGLLPTFDGLKYSGLSGGPTWFLLSLFLAEVFLFAILKGLKQYLIFIMLVGSLIFAYVLYLFKIQFPMFLSNICISVFFVGIGHFCGKYIFKMAEKAEQNSKNKYALGLFLFCISMFILNYVALQYTKVRLDIIYNQLGSPVSMLMGAFSGILFILSLSMIISKIQLKRLQQFLVYMGKNTLIIFALHMIIVLNITKYCKNWFASDLAYAGTKFLVVWLMMFLFIYLINRFAPWMIGKPKNKVLSKELKL